ncbi:MAG TPA: ABC transporter permease [Candidatus Dormibacteraeota bacterium]|jgi:ABC-type multidrug transport system permease subunit|nr:ABC transporter permease [Candidatus Dormibacteraeota bacterium]
MSLYWAFLRRDWFSQTSYKMFFVGQVAQMVALVAIVYLIGSAVGGFAGFSVGLGFVKFLLVGIAFADLFTACVQAGPNTLRDAQVTGTLETMMLAPIRTLHLILASSLFPILRSALRAIIVLTIGSAYFHFWPQADLLGAVLVVVPAYLAFAAVSLLGSAYVLAFKQGDPVTGGFMAVNAILGGAVIPLAKLPVILQDAGLFLPLTHALAGIRDSFEGKPLTTIGAETAVLWLSFAVLGPLAFLAFRAALKIAAREGSLVHY